MALPSASTALSAALVLLALLMAGCTGGTEPALSTGPDGRLLDDQGRHVDAQGDVVEPPVQLPAPTWTVGESWTQEWLVDGSTQPFIVQSVVAEASPQGYMLATPELPVAALHGAFAFPTLGSFAAADLTATTADGTTWPWYRFPLTENLTWQAGVDTKDGLGGTYQQTWDLVARNVTAQGADIEAKVGEAVVARYDFDAATGWFTEARFFSEEGWLQFHVKVTGHTTGFKGTLFDATGDFLFQTDFQAAPGTVPAGQPTGRFSPAAEHTHLLAFGYAYAGGGVAGSALVAPDGRHFPLLTDPAQAAAANGAGAGGMLVVESAPGDWTFATAGAGAFAWGGGVQAFGVTLRELQL